MNNHQSYIRILKFLVLTLFAFFINSSKAQESEFEDFNKILTLDTALYKSVYDSSQIKEKFGTINLSTPRNHPDLRLYLHDNSIIRGQLIAYHENGLFIYSSNQNTFGFYPFCKIKKLKIGRSPAKVIIASSLGFIGVFITFGVLANSYGAGVTLDFSLMAGIESAIAFHAIFLPLNELFRYYAHFNWLINQDKTIGQKLYKEILTKKYIWPDPKNLTGIVN